MARYLLLHAFPFDGTMWDSVAEVLRAEGHQVLAPDLRGFGSAPLGERSPAIAVMVDDHLFEQIENDTLHAAPLQSIPAVERQRPVPGPFLRRL